jgi:hypothetical protein
MIKSEVKRQVGSRKCSWVDNIKMDFGDIGWDVVDWIGLSQDMGQRRALVNMVMNLQVPKMPGIS